MYPPYQKIIKSGHESNNAILLAIQEAVDKTADKLFYIQAQGRHPTYTVTYTDQQLPGYIYTNVVHPKTGLPLFYMQELPYFSFKTQAELNQQIKLVSSSDEQVSDKLYHITTDDGIKIWTNIKSSDSEVFYIQLAPYPNSAIGVQKKILLDTRITQDSFQKPSEFQWQLDIGYKERYVPEQLTIDNQIPLLEFTQDKYTGISRQYALKIGEGLYKVQPLMYTEVFCKYKVTSYSSHGYMMIDSVEPVVEVLCVFEQFGTPIYTDIRQDSYQAYVAPYLGGEYLELI